MKTHFEKSACNRRFQGLSMILLTIGIFASPIESRASENERILRIHPAIELQFDSEIGAEYELQATDSADSGQWHSFGNVHQGTGEALSVLASTRNDGKRFFRIVQLREGSGRPRGVSTFGTVIDQPGHYVLTKDLHAGVDEGPAIIIQADDVTLDLKGHTIQGNGDTGGHDNLGIWLHGTEASPLRNVRITNGMLSGFHFAVWLDYSSNCRVTNMRLTGNRGGIGLNASTKNVIKQNDSSNNNVNNGVGILLQRNSSQNHIIENTCNNNFFQGIFLNGFAGGCSGNNLLSNTCNENGIVGIWLTYGSNRNNLVINTIMRNNAMGASPNGGIGLGYPGSADNATSGNIIVSNTLLDNTRDDPNSWDAFDNRPCDNVWQGNDFVVDNETADEAGPNGGCMK